jgi:hypothetical protein
MRIRSGRPYAGGVTGTSTLRRAVLVVGLLAVLFAPRLATGPGQDTPSSKAVGAAVLAPTFWSDGVSPAKVADDIDDVAPIATVALVSVLAALLLVWLEVEPRRWRPSLLLLTAPQRRGPPVATSLTSTDHEEQTWQRQRSGRSDRPTVTHGWAATRQSPSR